MTAIAIRLDQPATVTIPANLLRLWRRLSAMQRLARYPARRRAEREHARIWVARLVDHRH